MSQATIDIRHTDDRVALLVLAGDLDLSTVDDLESEGQRAIDRQPIALVVDLSHVTFLNSSVLGALVRTATGARARGVDFSLRQPTPIVRRLLDLSRLGELLPIEGEA